MFKRVVATILNRYLGKYIQDLDTENLNVGIFGGDVQLSDLKIKPDALYELDLPVEVKVGTIGRINIRIPWGGFSTQSVVLDIEEVYIIVAPITDRDYDPDKEKRLMRASKRRKLEVLEAENFLGTDAPESRSFLENLVTTIMNSLQVFVHNVHVRYEDSVTNNDTALACGMCIQSLSIETTNSKWKPITTSQGLSSVYQMIRLESFSIYCNPVCGDLVGKAPGLDSAAPYTWRNDMKKGLETFSIKGEEFDFILKPITAKMKVIVNKSNEARVPKLLVDFVLQDAATQLSRQQYLTILELSDSFQRININRKYRKYHPNKGVTGNSALWWKYAYESVLAQRVRPYTWSHVQNHRKNYRCYRDIYKQTLLKPTDTELKLDLQQCEDLLTITDVVIAREHAKLQLLHENPERVTLFEKQGTWWKSGPDSLTRTELQVTANKGRGIWAQLSPTEKNKLFDAIGYSEGSPTVPEKPKQYTEHKVNFTLANCSLSLVNRGHEILVLTLGQFLASLETRPTAEAFKLSARVESFVVEGASIEHDLVPIVTADNIYTGTTSMNFLSVDFEKNPLNSEADYGLVINLQPIEIVYHEHALSELVSFMQTATLTLSQLVTTTTKGIISKIKSVTGNAIRRHSAIQLNLDLKLPYFVIPELGTLQKGGNLSIVDFGQIKVKSELQPSNFNLEDATQMEIEERLYDRFHIDLTGFQLLFCDSGDVWRDSKKLNDSEFHLLPKVQCQVVFSNSIKPEYKLLPRYKLNISLTSLKVNISDRKIGSVMDFLDNLPLPSANTVHVSISSNVMCLASFAELQNDDIKDDPSRMRLTQIKILLVEAGLNKQNKPMGVESDKSNLKMALLQVDKNFVSTEHSDDESELWARTVDLPGFDDNVSPNNVITMLLRFIIGEIVIQLCRSSNRVDKPYLMLRVSKLCCDAALMEYGPAIQGSLGSVQLVDKLHTGSAGEYLELIATDPSTDVATLLYRKVRSDCPDFKSHFHNVEQSLVVDFTSACVILHREAFVTLNKYLQYLIQKIQSRELVLWQKLVETPVFSMSDIFPQSVDPPIPPGATKFSYSTRLQEFKLKFCDTDVDFLELKISGLESDCMFKANERMILRFYLTSFTIDDLSEMTLYPKIMSIDDEKIIDFKYVRHSPRLYKQSDIDNNKDDVKSDGSLKLHIGRVNIVVLFKMAIDIQNFMEPFVRPGLMVMVLHNIQKTIHEKLIQLRNCETRLHLALDIRAPSLLLPQKTTSPNLVILCLGDFSVENFFKEKTIPAEGAPPPIIDNILVKLGNLQLCRAVMTLAGSLEVQEPIIEPLSIKFDIKRAVAFHNTMRALIGLYVQPSSQILLYQVVGIVDAIRINLGQRDLSTILNVWTDNFHHGAFIGEVSNCWHASSPVEPPTPIPQPEDQNVKKLQAFFSQNEQIRRESTVRLTFDGLQIFLFTDCDEIMSSPIRDMNRGLCKLETGEATLSIDIFSDQSLEMKIALQACNLEDIRKDITGSIKRILQSHCGSLHVEDNSNISVSTPPIIDLTFRQTQTGDRCVDILVERTRLNLSVSFMLEFARFILDSLPPERSCEGGLINHGYVGDTNIQQPKVPLDPLRPASSADSTSGYFSSRGSCIDEQTGVSVSLQLRRPEIMLYSHTGGHSLLLRTEVLVDYSRHPGRESLVFSLSGLNILSKQQNLHKDKAPAMVLHPCDIEFAKSLKSIDDGLKITANVSIVDVHITASIIHTINTVIDEISTAAAVEETELPNVLHSSTEMEDLWSPKKISPYTFPQHGDLLGYGCHSDGRISELLTITVPKVRILFEIEEPTGRSPLVLLKFATEATVHNWSTSLQIKGELQFQASYFNSHVGSWEPLLEPCVEEEGVYRPYELLIKVFQAKAYPVSSRQDVDTTVEKEGGNTHKKVSERKSSQRVGNSEESETSADEQDIDSGSMIFVRKRNARNDHTYKKFKHESVSLISYPEDSDSDNEEGIMEKLASAIGHLFTGDSSDGEVSDSDESSGAEPSADTEDVSDVESTFGEANPNTGNESRAVFLKKHTDSIDSGLEAESVERPATYVMIESRDHLEITLTPQAVHILNVLNDSFSKPAQIPSNNYSCLINDITPNSTIKLLSKAEAGPAKVLMTSTYEHSDSLPSSPASTAATDFFSPVESDTDMECFEGGFYSVKLDQDQPTDLYSPYLRFPTEPIASLYKKVTDQRIRLHIPGFEESDILCPQRTCNKLHLLQPVKNNTRYYVVLNVICTEFGQRITVRSPLQIKNETSYALGIYYKKGALQALGYELIGESTNPFEDIHRVAIIEPDETFNVPLTVAHHCKLFILPAYVDTYRVSDVGLWWQELASDLNSPKDVICLSKDENDSTVFAVRALCEEGAPICRPSRLIPKYLIRLIPPLTVHNRLPYAIEIKILHLKYEVRIEAGEKASIYYLNLLKTHKINVNVPSYLAILWTGSFNLSPDMEEKVVTMVTEQDTEGGNKQLGLSVKVERGETCDVILYAPYWIINKTGLPLQLRASLTDVVYEAQGEEPLLFCYRKQRRHCVRLRAYHSSWSSAFSLDAFGTSGLVICKDRERKRNYRILLTVTLSEMCPHLTRIVTMLPNFLVSNESKRSLRFMEDNEKADLWIDLAPGQCIPFWPETEKMSMFVKFRDSKVVSQHFPITSNHQTVLRMDKGSGLCVIVAGGGDRPFSIIFRLYNIGDAPVRVDNLCEDLFLKIHQQHLSQVALLSPYQSMLYTWDDPFKERSLMWNVYNKKGKDFVADFWKDGYGQERVSFHIMKKQQPSSPAPPTVTAKLSASLKRLSTPLQEGATSSSEETESDEQQKPQLTEKTRKDKVIVYWVSYLEGQQRVLMFTQDERVSYQARCKIDTEKSHFEFFFSLKGVGLSLSTERSGQMQELAYLSLRDSAAIWEVNVAHRWKSLTLELASWIEDKWRQDVKRAQMKEYVHVDFEKMHMTKPFYGELRRHYYPAVWLQCRRSQHYSYFQCRIHRFQVENQLNDAVFPIVLHMTPIPLHIVRKVSVKPCLEFTVLKRNQPMQNHEVYKYVKLLVQEFSLQLDRTFVLSVYDMLSPWISPVKPSVRIRTDISILHQPIGNWIIPYTEPKVVIEFLHISPMNIHFTFSACGGNSQQSLHSYGKCYSYDFLHYIIDLLSASHTEIKGIKLKTTYLERKGLTVNHTNLERDIFAHYISQLMQQLHVLVLGEDVLGNPYSIVTDFSDGLGDSYYAPSFIYTNRGIQSLQENPEEYAGGLSEAAQMLMGHLCGGSSSGASLITAAVPISTLPLNFDEDYKKRRRLCMQQISDVPDSLTSSYKTFEIGVVLGMSGIVIKHLTGQHTFGPTVAGIQQQEGVEGFFRGIGKGLMGLLTKPTGGVLDCIFMASDGIKRASETGEDFILRTRLPRHLNQYLGVKPYSIYEATGKQLLNLLSKGHYADRDLYWAHASIRSEGKTFLLVTLHHIFLVEKCRLWGMWEVEWSVRVDDIMAVPHIENDKLVFKIRQDESFNYLNGDERFVHCEDGAVLQWLQKKIEAVMILNMEDKPCPIADT